jgi:cell division protein FtsA
VIRCAERCELAVADVVLGSLASAESVLSDDEKEIGVAVIDMGGGTTDVLLYVDGEIAYSNVLRAGGMNVTADIAAGLRTPMGEAERIKRNYGCALGRMVGDDEEIEVPGVGGHLARRVPRRVLSDIVEPRVEEIFAVIRKRIEDSGLLEQLSAGVVLTGGGALLSGMTEFAEEILGMPVRLGTPVGVSGLSQLVQGPQWSTAVGLVQFGGRALASSRLVSVATAREREAVLDPRGAKPRVAASAPRDEDFSAADIGKRDPSRIWSWLKQAF